MLTDLLPSEWGRSGDVRWTLVFTMYERHPAVWRSSGQRKQVWICSEELLQGVTSFKEIVESPCCVPRAGCFERHFNLTSDQMQALVSDEANGRVERCY